MIQLNPTVISHILFSNSYPAVHQQKYHLYNLINNKKHTHNLINQYMKFNLNRCSGGKANNKTC